MSSDRIYSWFLGPKGENADIFEKMITEALRDCVFWRRNFHPEDDPLISQTVKSSPEFVASVATFEQEFFHMLGELKSGIPFHSPRYIGHMLGDQLLPAIVGYFAAMLHNPNNVTPEASPVTTRYEIEVSQQLARMVGWEHPTWGHITSGGTVSNFEALWVARNLKYFSFAARAAALELDLDDVNVVSPAGETKELTSEMDPWFLLNLEPDQILGMRRALCVSFGKRNLELSETEVARTVDAALLKHSLSGKGIQQFSAELDLEDVEAGVIMMPATAHYSLIKVVEALGLGKLRIEFIPVDDHFRMDIDSLRDRLLACVSERRPVIALVSVLGSTEEGAVDYVHRIVEIQTELLSSGLSFYHHCDAAWGGYVRSLFFDHDRNEIERSGQMINVVVSHWPSDEIFQSFKSMREADSVTLDPHKLGYIPYPAGFVTFRNDSVKELISFDAPYIFQQEDPDQPFIGRYILDGSKPGAAAAACWLAHKVVPLDQTGYGLIIGKSIDSAQQLARKCSTDLKVSLHRQGVRLRVLTDPPDINVFCFVVNIEGNRSLRTMNDLNRRVYSLLRFDPNEITQRHEFIISTTDLEHQRYGQRMVNGSHSMEGHFEELGIDLNEFETTGHVTILRCTVIAPWIDLAREQNSAPDYVDAFAHVLQESIAEALRREGLTA